MKGMEWTFDTEAEQYEKMRPGYVPALYEDIFSYIPINGASHVLEIGIGGGQAALPFLETGCSLTAVECGGNLADLCCRKFRKFSGFTVVTTRFEEFEQNAHTYDLIYLASAFHWIPEAEGYTKVFNMLKNGGVFARFANHPFFDKGREELSKEIEKIYEVYMPGSHAPEEYGEEKVEKCALIAEKYGFTDISYYLYRRTRTFTAREYIGLLGTYSDHIALEEHIRKDFFSDIENTIEKFGGKITIYDTIDLQLARKP